MSKNHQLKSNQKLRVTNNEPRTTNHEQQITVRFLGTNGWYDTKTGNTLCILIETPNEYIILDAGNGIYKLDKYIKSDKPIYLFLSHFHLDHIYGLHILAKFKFKQGMNICIQKGMRKKLNLILSRDFTMPLKELPFKAKVIEIGEKTTIPFLESALPLKHPVPCMGLRFVIEKKIISFIPDTGLCNNAIKLAKNADLLISECALKSGQSSDVWPHLNPETAAYLAKKSCAKKLVLVHFDAEVYQNIGEREHAAKSARRIFKNTIAAKDDSMEALK